MKRIAYRSIICLVLFVIGCVFIQWQFNRPPIDPGKLELLTKKMTRDEVCFVLGRPTREKFGTNYLNQVVVEWSYSRTLSWPIVYVYFDATGKYERAVFDF